MDPVTMSIAYGLAQFAPKLIGLLTGSGKAEAVAEHAIEMAGVITGSKDPAQSLEMLRTNQELATRFREAVMANETELERMYLADRQDARKRDVAITQAGRYNWRSDVLAFLAVTGLVTCVWFVASDANLPERAVNSIMFVAGVLAAAVRDVYGYEFGSSRGSAEKSTVIEKMTRGEK